MLAGAGDSDIEEPTLLLDGFAVGAVRQGVGDGQRAVGQPDQEDGVPLQALAACSEASVTPCTVGAWRASARLRSSATSSGSWRSGRTATSSSTSSAKALNASQRSRARTPAGGSAVRPSGSRRVRTSSGSGPSGFLSRGALQGDE